MVKLTAPNGRFISWWLLILASGSLALLSAATGVFLGGLRFLGLAVLQGTVFGLMLWQPSKRLERNATALALLGLSQAIILWHSGREVPTKIWEAIAGYVFAASPVAIAVMGMRSKRWTDWSFLGLAIVSWPMAAWIAWFTEAFPVGVPPGLAVMVGLLAWLTWRRASGRDLARL